LSGVPLKTTGNTYNENYGDILKSIRKGGKKMNKKRLLKAGSALVHGKQRARQKRRRTAQKHGKAA
jgi:hypothetical protein